jgi:hypothetical protein
MSTGARLRPAPQNPFRLVVIGAAQIKPAISIGQKSGLTSADMMTTSTIAGAVADLGDLLVDPRPALLQLAGRRFQHTCRPTTTAPAVSGNVVRHCRMTKGVKLVAF